MRYPNLRYGKLAELQYYAMGVPVRDLARRLRRDERTVRDWLSGRARIPWWVPEILRLQRMEAEERHRQMFWATGAKMATRLGVVRGDVIELAAVRPSGGTPADQSGPAGASDRPGAIEAEC